MKWHLTIITTVLAAQVAFAQSTTSTTTAADVGAAKVPFKLTGSLQSISWSGRLHETQSATGERFRSRVEYQLGVKHDSGWALAGNGRYETVLNGDSTQDKKFIKDPSLKLSHPALYKSDTLEIGGMLRQYFPVSDGTTKDGVMRYHTAYYSTLDAKLGGKWTLENLVGPRYVWAQHTDDEMRFYTETWTDLIYNSSDKLKFGVGNAGQVSVPRSARTGVCDEIYPFVKLFPVSQFEISAAIYVPVLSEGPIDGPSSVSTANMYGELSLKASL